MKWNNEDGYITYTTSLQNIKTLLGVSTTFFDLREETIPYVTYTLSYINKKLILLGEGVERKLLIEEIFNIYDHGADLILNNSTKDLLLEMGISDTDIYIEDQEIPYNQDRFVFSWSNVMTSFYTMLKLMYADLLAPATDVNCGCKYSSGDTAKSLEEWTSGVYPNDEGYVVVATGTVGSADWRSVDQWPDCNRCYRSQTN